MYEIKGSKFRKRQFYQVSSHLVEQGAVEVWAEEEVAE